MKTLYKSFVKIAAKAITPGPVKTFPIPLTKPFAKELPSSSPPPNAFFMPSIALPNSPTASPRSGFIDNSPIIPTSSFNPEPAWDAIADMLLFKSSFFLAASPAAFDDISVACCWMP